MIFTIVCLTQSGQVLWEESYIEEEIVYIGKMGTDKVKQLQ